MSLAWSDQPSNWTRLGRYAALMELPAETVLCRGLIQPAVFQKQPRRGDAPQNCRPSVKHMRRVLGRIVEAAKRHAARFSAGSVLTSGVSAGGP